MSGLPSRLVLLNPTAGALKKDRELLSDLSRHTALAGAEIRLLPDEENLRRAARCAVEEERECLVIGGGDGTLHAALAAVYGATDPDSDPPRGPVVGILPLGTGNDLARSLGVDDLETALEALTHPPRVTPVDQALFTAGDGEPELWVNTCLSGFGGEVQEATTSDMKDTWGPLAYLRGGIEAFESETSYPVRIRIDDGPEEEVPVYNLIVANGRYAGGGAPVAPRARIDDGKLDLVIIPGVDLSTLMALAPRILAGRHLDREEVRWERGERITVETDRPMAYSVDGEVRQCESATLEVDAGALRMVVGPEAEAIDRD